MSYTTKLDQAQIMKSVFDEATNTLKVGLNSVSMEMELSAADGDSVETRSLAVDVTTLSNAVSAAAGFNSAAVDVLKYNVVGIQLSWTGLDAVNGTLQVQGSIDGTVWFAEGALETLSTAAGDAKRKISDNEYKSMRVVYTAGANTAGTITVKYVLKG